MINIFSLRSSYFLPFCPDRYNIHGRRTLYWYAGKKQKDTACTNCAQAMPHPTYVVYCIECLCFGAVPPNSPSMESVFSSCNSVYGLLYWISPNYTRGVAHTLTNFLIRTFIPNGPGQDCSAVLRYSCFHNPAIRTSHHGKHPAGHCPGMCQALPSPGNTPPLP